MTIAAYHLDVAPARTRPGRPQASAGPPERQDAPNAVDHPTVDVIATPAISNDKQIHVAVLGPTRPTVAQSTKQMNGFLNHFRVVRSEV